MLSNSSDLHLRQVAHVWKYPKPEVYEHSLVKGKGEVQLKTCHEGSTGSTLPLTSALDGVDS